MARGNNEEHRFMKSPYFSMIAEIYLIQLQESV